MSIPRIVCVLIISLLTGVGPAGWGAGARPGSAPITTTGAPLHRAAAGSGSSDGAPATSRTPRQPVDRPSPGTPPSPVRRRLVSGGFDRVLSRIFEREPLHFSVSTLLNLWSRTQREWARARQSPRLALAPFRAAGAFEWGMLSVLILAMAEGVWIERRNRELAWERWGRWCDRFFPTLAPALTAIGKIVTRAVLPFAIWFVWTIVGGATHTTSAWFWMAANLILLWCAYRVIDTALDEIILRPGTLVAPERAARLLRRLRLVLRVGIVLSAAVLLSRRPRYPSDLTAFLAFLEWAALTVLLAFALFDRDTVMGLLPRLHNGAYQLFLTILRRWYYLLAFGSLVVSLLGAVGFWRLVDIVFGRGWALVVLILGAAVLQRYVVHTIERYVMEPHPDSITAADLARILIRDSAYCFLFLVVWIGSGLLELRGPLGAVFRRQIIFAGSKFSITIGSIVLGVLILWIFLRFGELISALLNHFIYPHMGLEVGAADTYNRLLRYVIIAIAIFLALDVIGISGQDLTIVAGGLSVGIGFGLQNIANNLASGLILLLGRYVRKGDFISLNNTTGTVAEVGMRATVVRTIDNVDILVPNSQLISQALVNYSYHDPNIRVHVPIGVSYDANPEFVRPLLEEVARESPLVLKEPKPQVILTAFGDSSVNYELLVWISIRETTETLARSELNYRIYAKLAEHNVEIPYPQRDIHVRSGAPAQQLLGTMAPKDERADGDGGG